MTQSIIDISPPITSKLAVFPGDTPMQREMLLDMQRGDNITLSTLRATVHLGAHVDGPNHYGQHSPGVDAIPLGRFVGPCQVLHVRSARDRRVGENDIKEPVTQPRVLLRTDSFPDPDQWNADFAGMEPELVDALHRKGVVLVGIDTPSVDSAGSRELPAHHRFLANDMSILEGLILSDVAAGIYELIALPLRLIGFDASPVRAVLRPLPDQ